MKLLRGFITWLLVLLAGPAALMFGMFLKHETSVVGKDFLHLMIAISFLAGLLVATSGEESS